MVDSEKRLYLPVEPFRQWVIKLLKSHNGNAREVGNITGMGERRVQLFKDGLQSSGTPQRRVMVPMKRVTLDAVDRALICEGNTYLWDLYPELYDWHLDAA